MTPTSLPLPSHTGNDQQAGASVHSSACAAALQQYVDCGDIAGAVTLVARDGKIVEFDALGYANLADRRPMKKETLFWVASMTKPITAAAILLLLDEGKLALSDPVEKYLPEFENSWLVREKCDEAMVLERPSRPVALLDLLTHTHGLEEPPFPLPGAPLSTCVMAAARSPLQFEPGTQWKYGNAGMNTLGRVVEVVSDLPFEVFLKVNFFDPLGMKNSTFHPDEEQLQQLAKSYKRPPEAGPLVEAEINLLNGDVTRNEQSISPGGGLFSTTEDIFRFYQMLLNGGEFAGRRYLSEATVKEMLTSQTGELEAGFKPGMAWGLGVDIVKCPQGWTDVLPVGTWGHGGAYGTSVMGVPQKRLLLIMMIQRADFYLLVDGPKFCHAFDTAVMKKY